MFPDLLHCFWLLLQVFTIFSLAIPAILCLFYFVRYSGKKSIAADDELHEEKDYAIVVSASGSAENMQALIESLLQLDYTNYIIYITGKCSPDMVIQNNKLVFLRTAKTYESEVLLHRFAIENFRRPHTHIAILDGDASVNADFLTNLNFYFHRGYQAVQCNQALTQKTGIMNLLQSATGLYQNFFTGKMIFGLGSSATLSGSGNAFTVTFYKQCLKKIKAGEMDFASALQLQAILRGQQVAFASCALVYSATPQDARGLARHHALRIHSWLIDTFFYLKMALKGIVSFDKNRFLYGLLCLRLPLPTSIVVAIACLVVNVRIHPVVASVWAGALLLLPAYLLIAGKQVSPASMQTAGEADSHAQESIDLYGEELEYDVIAQSV